MTIAIDFDGTIVEHRYPAIGKELPFATATLRQLMKDGHKLVLWSVREGDLLHGTEGKAYIIIANIIADIIIMLLPDIPGKLMEDGIFLASGIIEERREDVEAAAAKQGLKVDAVDRRGGWVVLQFSKK